MEFFTPYQVFLLAVLILWPAVIIGVLFLMGRLEQYVSRLDASTPEEAGLEPIEEGPREPEVRVVLGDQVIGEPE